MVNNIVALLLSVPILAQSNQFDPYTLNGGLVSAVAGRDFVVLAADTRLVGDSGYDLLGRNHVRLWGVENDIEIPSIYETEATEPLKEHSTLSIHHAAFVASAGCASDCEELKRTVRYKLRAATDVRNRHAVGSVARLLSQVLYSRRVFPFYSFCVVAGVEKDGGGAVFTYDAIGSHERVRAACNGQGKELMQPILDRSFGTPTTSTFDDYLVDKPELLRVNCSKEDTLDALLDAYRSVSERDTMVGDQVVFVVLRKNGDACTCEVLTAPLKEH